MKLLSHAMGRLPIPLGMAPKRAKVRSALRKRAHCNSGMKVGATFMIRR